jgi:hypothetical protein
MRPGRKTEKQRGSSAISFYRGHESRVRFCGTHLDLVDTRDLQPLLLQRLEVGDPEITNPHGPYLAFGPVHKVDEVPPRIYTLFRAHERAVDEEEVDVFCFGRRRRVRPRNVGREDAEDGRSGNDSKRCDRGSSGLARIRRETSSREQEGKRIERELVEPTTHPNRDRSDSSPPFSYTLPPYALPLALWS